MNARTSQLVSDFAIREITTPTTTTTTTKKTYQFSIIHCNGRSHGKNIDCLTVYAIMQASNRDTRSYSLAYST